MRSFFWHVTLWQKKTCWKVIACMTKVSFRDYIPKRRFQGSHWLLRFNLGNRRLKSWNEISEVIVSNYYKRLFSATAFSNALGKLLFCRKKTHQFLRFNAKISIALHTMLSILCMWSGWILPTVPSPWGALVGLAPQTKPKPRQIETWNTIKQWSVCQFLECQVPPHKRKAPLLKTSWWRFWLPSFSTYPVIVTPVHEYFNLHYVSFDSGPKIPSTLQSNPLLFP